MPDEACKSCVDGKCVGEIYQGLCGLLEMQNILSAEMLDEINRELAQQPVKEGSSE